MSAQPAPVLEPSRRALPEYLPARKINEFVYCPRLFYFEQVEDVFVHNQFTAEGAAQHKRVDKEGRSAPKPGEESEEPVVVRSIELSSEEHRVVAKLDLAEFADGLATPVDYKHGRPMKDDDGLQAWPTDRAQLAVQALVLRANGYRCEEGVVFYQRTRQRVRIRFDEATIAEAEQAIAGAWETAAATVIPPPLVDSPKCPGCSLVGICMPDETWQLQSPVERGEARQLGLFEDWGCSKPGTRQTSRSAPKPCRPLQSPVERGEARQLPRKQPGREVARRAARRPDLNTQGLRVAAQGTCRRRAFQVNLMGNIRSAPKVRSFARTKSRSVTFRRAAGSTASRPDSIRRTSCCAGRSSSWRRRSGFAAASRASS